MGIASVFDSILIDLSVRIGFSGKIGTLGVMDIEGNRHPRDYFNALGYDSIEAIDVSDYEGADHIFDLNEPLVPAELKQRYDAVFNGGTLEHVFNVPNALAAITNMLKENGLIFHIIPCNGWVNHGFYQFSPILMFDYYDAAGFKLIQSLLCSYDPSNRNHWFVSPMGRDDLPEGQAGSISDGRVYLYFFVARRLRDAIDRPCPVQQMYSGKSSATSAPWFMPYEVRNGMKIDPEVKFRKHLDVFEKETGECWQSTIESLEDVADNAQHPHRSKLLLFEDGKPLGAAHSAHQKIRDVGLGAFSHWGAKIYMSTSDNSDPNQNKRLYEVLIIETSTN